LGHLSICSSISQNHCFASIQQELVAETQRQAAFEKKEKTREARHRPLEETQRQRQTESNRRDIETHPHTYTN